MVCQVGGDCKETCDAEVEYEGHEVVHTNGRGIRDSSGRRNACKHNTCDVEEEIDESFSLSRFFLLLSYGGSENTCCRRRVEKEEEEEESANGDGVKRILQHHDMDAQRRSR